MKDAIQVVQSTLPVYLLCARNHVWQWQDRISPCPQTLLREKQVCQRCRTVGCRQWAQKSWWTKKGMVSAWGEEEGG